MSSTQKGLQVYLSHRVRWTSDCVAKNTHVLFNFYAAKWFAKRNVEKVTSSELDYSWSDIAACKPLNLQFFWPLFLLVLPINFSLLNYFWMIVEGLKNSILSQTLMVLTQTGSRRYSSKWRLQLILCTSRPDFCSSFDRAERQHRAMVFPVWWEGLTYLPS